MTAFLDPKAASSSQLLAACQAISATCGEQELRAFLEAGDTPPLGADELRAALGVQESPKETEERPPCMACSSVVAAIDPALPFTPEATDVEG